MQYTVRAYIKGKDERMDEMCRVFCSMERTAYNLLRKGGSEASVKVILRARYGVNNARWCQSAINQAEAVAESQKEVIQYRIDQCLEKVKNMRAKTTRILNPLKIQGCEAKIARILSRVDELRGQMVDGSYPRVVFGSSILLHQLSIADGARQENLRKEWRERRSNHFFSVGQANSGGNANARLSCGEGGSFFLELRNWLDEDFHVKLSVPEHVQDILKGAIEKAESVKFGKRGELLEGGIAYTVRVVRSRGGYQVMVSFKLDEPIVQWTGRIGGIDINPEGIACTVVSSDGNLIATRFFRDSRLIISSKNKRKWVLENLVNKLLRWCRDTRRCNAIAVEELKFRGAYDSSPRANYKLSNFMKNKMLQTMKLHSLKMGMLYVEENPAYTSMVATGKYGRRFGGFNRHELAAFVIARRALGHGEAPVADCLPRNKKERSMWNHCIRYYGHLSELPTLPGREPLEWKSGRDVKGGRTDDELLAAPPAITPSQMGLSHAPEGAPIIGTSIGRAGRVHPNGHTNRGDGARRHRVSLPGIPGARQHVSSRDAENATKPTLHLSPDTEENITANHEQHSLKPCPLASRRQHQNPFPTDSS